MARAGRLDLHPFWPIEDGPIELSSDERRAAPDVRVRQALQTVISPRRGSDWPGCS